MTVSPSLIEEKPVDKDNDGYSEADGDCDDGDAAIHPGADENCSDGKDNNCDGYIDGSDPQCGKPQETAQADSGAKEGCGGCEEIPGATATRAGILKVLILLGAPISLIRGLRRKREEDDIVHMPNLAE
ncbi:putative metal-binding motif-containing protein [Candidatus Peregrinibacteria bacterium]|nr:putative metal-binding motif-containing protein [Candidatus Peregrinibacteria bacterium]